MWSEKMRDLPAVTVVARAIAGLALVADLAAASLSRPPHVTVPVGSNFDDDLSSASSARRLDEESEGDIVTAIEEVLAIMLGVTIGTLVCACGLIALIVYCCCCRKKNKAAAVEEDDAVELEAQAEKEALPESEASAEKKAPAETADPLEAEGNPIPQP